jgi:hypothetical protein
MPATRVRKRRPGGSDTRRTSALRAWSGPVGAWPRCGPAGRPYCGGKEKGGTWPARHWARKSLTKRRKVAYVYPKRLATSICGCWLVDKDGTQGFIAVVQGLGGFEEEATAEGILHHWHSEL